MTSIPTTTVTSPTAWSPDVQAFLAGDVVADALINKAATVVTQQLEGDSPVARIPWVDDAAAEFVAEGAEIVESVPALAEITVATAKIAQLIPISREQFHQNGTSGLLSTSVKRAIIKRANQAFLSQAKPENDAITPPEGIITQAGVISEDTITTNLDPLAEVVGTIEEFGGTPSLIVAAPGAWATLRTIKTETGAATSLLGAGTSDAEKRLLGIPVVTSPAVPAGKLLVIDPSAIAAAVGNVMIAQSEHLYFANDSIALRATWRIGWKVAHKNRLGVLTVGA